MANYTYLDLLEQAWTAVNRQPQQGGLVTDVGCANFWYSRTLHTFFRPAMLTGVNLKNFASTRPATAAMTPPPARFRPSAHRIRGSGLLRSERTGGCDHGVVPVRHAGAGPCLAIAVGKHTAAKPACTQQASGPIRALPINGLVLPSPLGGDGNGRPHQCSHFPATPKHCFYWTERDALI